MVGGSKMSVFFDERIRKIAHSLNTSVEIIFAIEELTGIEFSTDPENQPSKSDLFWREKASSEDHLKIVKILDNYFEWEENDLWWGEERFYREY